MRTCLLLLGLAACASAPPARPSAPPRAEDDGLLLRSLEREQGQLADELDYPGPPAPCEQRCGLRSQICDDSGRICQLAARNRDDPKFAQACSDAADRCAEADVDLKTAGCTCG